MNDIRKRKFDDRPIEFTDEIKVHVSIWMNDVNYRNLSPYLKDAMTQLVDALDISETMKRAGGTGEMSNKNVHARRMIQMYKDKYLELTDLICEEDIAGATFIILSRLAEKIEREGSSPQEYVVWFYDAFLRDPSNRKFIPPNIKLMTSDFITQKFFFDNKDKFKIRKKDAVESKCKLELMKIGSDLFEKTNDEQLGQMLVAFGKNNATYLKTENSIILVAEKTNDRSIIDKVNDLREQRSGKKKEGKEENGN